MKILINGAGFENKGAEAMLRTVQTEFAHRLPSVEFFLWRPPGSNHRIASASGIRPLTLPFYLPHSKWHLVGDHIGRTLWSVREIYHWVGMKRLSFLFNRKKMYEKACLSYLTRATGGFDVLIDISGFAYKDVGGAERVEWIQPAIDYCQQHNNAVFFLPQAWGSFDNPNVKRAVSNPLSNPTVSFYSRDESSSRYLEELLDKDSIKPYPDIAFRFQGGTREQGEWILRNMGCSMKRPIVGISPNMRVFERFAEKGTGNKYLHVLIMLIKHCLENHDVDVVLQANEIIEYRNLLDDRYLCSLIAASVNRNDRCFMTREPLTAEESKALIGHFDYIIGSRFHSFVFAFSHGIPGMAVSWSHKYRELFSLFGLENDVCEREDIDSRTLIETFERGWSNRQQQRALIIEANKDIQTKVDTLFTGIAEKILGGLTE